MKSKRLFLSLLVLLGVCAWGASSANATTWYVRDGGGTAAQCTGKTNAVYPGTGSNQACAFNHPAWVTGAGYSYPGDATSPLWVGGDTMYIVGDSDLTPGAQAQFMVGYGMPNTSSCGSSYAYACYLNPIPAGTSSSNPTRILGIGTHQPQLWGTQGISPVLTLTAGNLDFENVEVTDHSSCSSIISGSNPGYNGYPGACANTDGSYPYGTYSKIGLEFSGTNITTKNLWLHNFAITLIDFPGNVSNWNSTNDRFEAAGEFLTGSNSGLMNFGGNNTMTNDIWAFGGCMEKYPLPDPGNVKDTTNYVNCADQAAGGTALGGGFAMQNDSNGACGNWTISDTQFLFNLKSNFDFLHCNGTGTLNIYRTRSEGSAGEALKVNVGTLNVEESQLIGNAPVWESPAFQAIKAPYSSSGGTWGYDVCRGHGVTVIYDNNSEQANFINDDVTGNCTSLFETAGTTCTGMSINVHNSKLIAGYGYDISQQTDVIYNSGSDGDGGGACGPGTIPLNENYNDIYNEQDTSHCTGADSLCGVDPKVLAETSGSLSTVLGPTSYYSGTSLGDQLYLQSTSPLRGKATTNVTFTNGSSKDYNNYPQNSPPDIGAIQYNSCILADDFCSISGECCGGVTCSSEGQCGTASKTPQPVVAITSPTNGSSFTAGSDITITATASETNGTISNVAFYYGTTLLGQDSTSPYSYVVANVPTGIYTLTAIATDANGVSVISSPIIVNVVEASLLPSSPVVAITSPATGSSYTAGSNVTITTTASETNGTISNISLYNVSGVLLGTSNKSPYSFVDTDLLAGTYSFYAQATDVNGVSTTSNLIIITVTALPAAPSITTQPVSVTVTAPATATFKVVATGTPAPSYQWQQEASGASTYTAISAATSASYTTPATTTANSGTKFECVVSNASGSVTSSAATLTVNTLPSITTQPVSVTVTAPATATFTVVAAGTPAPNYQWEQEASGATSYTVISGATSASYKTAATTTANSGTKYECVVSNASGDINSSPATLTVNPAPAAPSITTQPVSVTVTAPATATFKVVATGTPAPSYQWKEEASGASAYTAISGATSASYTTPATTTSNSGTKFECVVSNASGSVTSNAATLTVNSTPVAPSIITQPVGVTITQGDTAIFTIVATGIPAPSYQWQQEASSASTYTAISGATSSSYSTSSASSGTKYECVVSNASGSVTSNAAILYVEL